MQPCIIHAEDPSRTPSLGTRYGSPPGVLGLVIPVADLAGQGTISATYLIPDIISIPGDGQTYNVTVARLELEAELSWVTVPKYDKKVYIKVRLTLRPVEVASSK